MDINDFRTLGTVLVFIAFIGVIWWAYGPGSKHRFDEAEQLPFAESDDHPHSKRDEE